MHTYARIENGMVVEIIGPLLYDDGTEIPIGLRFPQSVLDQLVDITDEVPRPDQFWTYDGSQFFPPEE